MRLLVYAADLCQGKRLLDAIDHYSGISDLEYITSLKSLLQRLRKCGAEGLIAVLMPSEREELTRVKQIFGWMTNMKIILVLPDRDRKTVSLGHSLYPRFISYIDSNFEDVSAVLGKILENMQSGSDYFKKREVLYGK